MKPPNAREKEIQRKAWRVYKLVCANRDVEADAELRAMGADTVAVANALITGDFLQTRLKRIGNTFGCVLMILIPLCVPVALYTLIGPPHGVLGSIFTCTACIGVAALSIAVEVWLAIGAMTTPTERRCVRENLAFPRDRVREIAFRVIAEDSGSSSALIDTILKADGVTGRLSRQTYRNLDAALTRLLSEASHKTLIELNNSSRGALHSRFWRIVSPVLLHPMPVTAENASAIEKEGVKGFKGTMSYRIPIFDYEDPSHHEYADVALAILRTYEHIPDTAAIDSVRRVADVEIDGLSAEWQRVVEAAKRVLPMMEENVRRSHGSDELLRGSEPAEASPDELLRPPADEADTSADELLRPHNDGEDAPSH